MNTKKNYKILIAEDEESLAMLIDYNLIKDGYQTNIVKDGELVHMLERHHIEGRPAEMIAENLKEAYNEHC